MATKTSKTKKTAAATKAAPKTTARANTKAPKRKAAPRAVPNITKDFDLKSTLIGGGVGALVGGLATKLIFFR